VLVVDDASTDGTARVVGAVAGADARVRLLARGERGGVAECLNQVCGLGWCVEWKGEGWRGVDLWLPGLLVRHA
jgi:hypothetical protein